MEERRIRILAALIFFAGLIVLSYMVWADSTEEKTDGETSLASSESAYSQGKSHIYPHKEDNSRLTVTGVVVQVIDRGKVSFLKLSPASRYQLVSFDKIDVKEKDKVQISGKVQTYKGRKEIVIDSVTIID